MRDVNRIVLPPASFMHEKDKHERRMPAAIEFIKSRKLNETFGPAKGDVGVVVLGGMWNTTMRALEYLGLADSHGRCSIPLYVLNVAYPLIEDELIDFCHDKRAVIVVEEGAPDYIERDLNTILRRRDIQTKLSGKDVLPMGGEYTAPVLTTGLRKFLATYARELLGNEPPLPDPAPILADPRVKRLAEVVPPRPPGFCIGCPERPIFAAMKLVEQELGQHHVSADIGCHLFSILPPFNIGATTMGYGLGPASASAFNVPAGKRSISVLGDGGFWHNGLASSVGNAVFNKHDGVTLIVDNFYSSATGGQDIPSSRALNPRRKTNNSIVNAVRGVGAQWVRQIDRTYDVGKMRDTLREALTTKAEGPKIIVASSECMLNKQRRVRPILMKAIKGGQRVVREKFGVDEDICTGDHACIRLSGCPSLSVKQTDDPLRDDPVAAIDENCVGCGNCGEVAEAAALCPSFYRAEVLHNPTAWDRRIAALRAKVIGWLEARRSARTGSPRRRGGVSSERATRAPGRSSERISLAILAMGGQGGGVLADWIVWLAEAQGWAAQSTSVPGVAQRTGATIYYIEMAPPKGRRAAGLRAHADAGRRRRRDGVRAHGGRAFGASRPRHARPHDADRLDPPRAGRGGETGARRRRRRSGRRVCSPRNSPPNVSSPSTWRRWPRRREASFPSTMFGALAASGALPFARAAFEEAIRAGGSGVEVEPRAFNAAFEQTNANPHRADPALS